MKQNVLQLVSGDNDGIPIVCKNPMNDEAVDVSFFANIIFTVRDKNKNKLIQKSLTGTTIIFDTDGSDGLLTILIAKKDTHNLKGIYRYDIEFETAGGVKTTPVRSFVKILEDQTYG